MNRSKVLVLSFCMIALPWARIEAGLISFAWGKVKQQFAEHPLMTGCIASGIIGATAACCNRLVACYGHQTSIPVSTVPTSPVVDQPECHQISEEPIHSRGIVAALMEHPKTVACAACFLAGALGYEGFTKLRDREINAQLDAKIDAHLNECQKLQNCEKEFKDTISVWGKRCDFTIKVQASGLVDHIRVGHIKVVCDKKVVRIINLSS